MNYNETNEMNDDRTFNIFNELTGRDTDDDGSDDYTLAYDANGNRTDDGQSYDIILDAWNRVVEIQDRSDSSTVAKFAYNGLNHKISMHVDTDTDGDVDVNDDIEYYALTQGWQVVAMYLNTDSDPTEQYVYNNAGLDGRGGSSTINDMLLRDRDTNADTVLNERTYNLRDHIRSDTVAIIDDTGAVLEWIKYSANGEPTNYMMGDANDSGGVDTTDIIQVLNWSNASTYDARGDWDGDGDVDIDDVTGVSGLSGSSTGYNVLSRSDVNNDFGYTGQRHLIEVSLIDYRNRFYGAQTQTFIQRDPAGFVDGPNVYAYVKGDPVTQWDPMGLVGGCDSFFSETCRDNPGREYCGGMCQCSWERWGEVWKDGVRGTKQTVDPRSCDGMPLDKNRCNRALREYLLRFAQANRCITMSPKEVDCRPHYGCVCESWYSKLEHRACQIELEDNVLSIDLCLEGGCKVDIILDRPRRKILSIQVLVATTYGRCVRCPK